LQLLLKQLQRRQPVPAGHVPDLIAAMALKSGVRAKSGFAIAVKATAFTTNRSGGTDTKQMNLQPHL
jgi:hypothetical protein